MRFRAASGGVVLLTLLLAAVAVAAVLVGGAQDLGLLAMLIAVLAVAGIALAVTGHRLERARARHADHERQLLTLLEAMTEAITVFDRNGQVMDRNPAAVALFDLYAPDEPVAQFLLKWQFIAEDGSMLPPDEHPLATAMRTGEVGRHVVGIRKRSDNAVRWLSMSLTPIRAGTEVIGYVSCSTDITERAETIRTLRILTAASERLSSSLIPSQVMHAITAAASEIASAVGEEPRRAAVLTVDKGKLVTQAEHDPHASTGTGEPVDLADQPHARQAIETRRPVNALIHPDDFGPTGAAAVRRLGVKNGAMIPILEGTEVVGLLAIGGRQRALVSESQMRALTTLVGIGGLALSNAIAHQRVEALARTDALTGAGNRRALDERLAQLERSRFALVVVDVDDLKSVNDLHGHEAGDDLLVAVAAALAAELRAADLLTRVGGDEFVALLPDCDAHAAMELGERLQDAVARLRFSWGSASVSVGSAAGPPGVDPAVTARAADRALYAAKASRGERGPGTMRVSA